MYKVMGADGLYSQDMDINTLQILAQRGELVRSHLVYDPISGQSLYAEDMLRDKIVFPDLTHYIHPQQFIVPQPDSSLLGLRLGGYLIDGLCTLPLQILAHIPFIGLLAAPLLVLYWLSRDSFFGGQSIGKRAVGLRVVRLDGKSFNWGNSMQRNIIFVPLILSIIPFIGIFLGLGSFLIINMIELIFVITTQQRIGDNFAHTVVVRA